MTPNPITVTPDTEVVQAARILLDKGINGLPVVAEGGRLAAEDASPISDVRASREYRKLMVEVLSKRALAEAAGLAAK
jgi:CBS domain-containing protein